MLPWRKKSRPLYQLLADVYRLRQQLMSTWQSMLYGAKNEARSLLSQYLDGRNSKDVSIDKCHGFMDFLYRILLCELSIRLKFYWMFWTVRNDEFSTIKSVVCHLRNPVRPPLSVSSTPEVLAVIQFILHYLYPVQQSTGSLKELVYTNLSNDSAITPLIWRAVGKADIAVVKEHVHGVFADQMENDLLFSRQPTSHRPTPMRCNWTEPVVQFSSVRLRRFEWSVRRAVLLKIKLFKSI